MTDADKVLLVCPGALFKETALPETSEITGSATSHRVSHCSGAHAITSYPERRGKHVLMEHSEDFSVKQKNCSLRTTKKSTTTK